MQPSKKMESRSFLKYGHFSSDGTEFVITRQETPRPWVNYLTNGDYCLILSNSGSGYSFYRDPGVNRVTRWNSENYLKRDVPGRYLYLRDQSSGKFWSAGHLPTRRSSRSVCRHGLGYTTLTNVDQEIESEITYFVPQNEPLEIWLVKIKNLSEKARTLKVFPFVEWSCGNWMPELSVRNLYILVNAGHFEKNGEILIARKFPWGGKEHPYLYFMGSSLKAAGFDIDYEKFIGRDRDYSNPVAVEQGRCSNSQARGTNMVGALEHDLVLKPGREKEFAVVVGVTPCHEAPSAVKSAINRSRGLVQKYRDLTAVRKALEDTKSQWRKAILERNVTVETPDRVLNNMVNVWMKYQISMNNYWGRSATFYHEGWGEFGYRNTAQDAWAMVPLHPEYAKEKLVRLCEHQKRNGQPLPGWSLELGPSTHRPPSDFPIWLPMLLIAFLKETGEEAFLKKKIKYFDGGSGTAYDHAKRATRFLQDTAKSPRGIPLMGTQDWNDAFDRTGVQGKGESIWLGMGLCVSLKNLEELSLYLGEAETARDCRKRYERMKAILNRHAWDGNWYRYAFNDFGEPVGSKANKEGRIHLNAQTWAMIAGLPDQGRLGKILKAIDRDLDTPFGPVLFTPAYTVYDDRLGRITAFAPGTKENASAFCHGGAFKIYADLSLGRPDQAYDTLQKILPCALNKDIETYKAEPYVFPEYVIGPGNLRYGEAAFSWLTGSVDWVFIAVTEKMLGLEPGFEGLRIRPCLPKAWKSARAVRHFRGAIYEVQIRRSDQLRPGEMRIVLDGKLIKTDLIVPHRDGRRHSVVVTVG